MTFPAYENLQVDFWVYPGKVGVSRPTLCLFHQTLDVGSPILIALQELHGETPPARRTLTFATCAQKRPVKKLSLNFTANRDDLRVMNIQVDGDSAIIEMTRNGLDLMVDKVSAWLNGKEDFGVSPGSSHLRPKEFGPLDRESKELWFWGPGYAGP